MQGTCSEVGVVTSVDGQGRAVVRIRRVEACHACQLRGACLSLGGGGKTLDLEMENRLDAKVGDRVAVSLAEASVVKASAVAYGVPLVLFTAGTLLGWVFAAVLGWDRGLVPLVGAGLGLAMGFIAARVLGRRLARDPAFVPTMARIVTT